MDRTMYKALCSPGTIYGLLFDTELFKSSNSPLSTTFLLAFLVPSHYFLPPTRFGRSPLYIIQTPACLVSYSMLYLMAYTH